MDRSGGQEPGWTRLILAFLEERNIKWLLAVGISLVLAASAYFVHTNWQFFTAYTFLQYLLVGGFTAACTGTATITGERIGLPSTARAFHLTALFLVPLNFVAMWLPEIGLFRGRGAAPELGYAIGLAAYPFLWWVLDRSLRGALGSTTGRMNLALMGAAGLLPWSSPGTVAGGVTAGIAWSFAVWGISVARRHYVLGRRLEAPELFLLPTGGLVAILLAHVLAASPEGPWTGLVVALFAIPMLHLAHALGEARLARPGAGARDLPATIALGAHVLILVGTAIAFGGRLHGNVPLVGTLGVAAGMLAATGVVRASRLARRLAISAGAPLLLAALAVSPVLDSVWNDAVTLLLGAESAVETAAALILAGFYLTCGLALRGPAQREPDLEPWGRDLLAAAGTLAGLAALGVALDPRAAVPVFALCAIGTLWSWRRTGHGDLLFATAVLVTLAIGQAALFAGAGVTGLLWVTAATAALWSWAMPVVTVGEPGPVILAAGQGQRHPLGAAALICLEAGLLLSLLGGAADRSATAAIATLAAMSELATGFRGLGLGPVTWTLGLATLLSLREWFPAALPGWLIWTGFRVAGLLVVSIGAALWAAGRAARRGATETKDSTHPLDIVGPLLVLVALAAAPFSPAEGIATAAAAALFFAVAAGATRSRPFLTGAGGASALALALAAHGMGGPLGAAATMACLAHALTGTGFGLRARIEGGFPAATPWGRRYGINPAVDLGALLAVAVCLTAPTVTAGVGGWHSAVLLALAAAAAFAAGSVYYAQPEVAPRDGAPLPAMLLTGAAILASVVAVAIAGWESSAIVESTLLLAFVSAAHHTAVWWLGGRLAGPSKTMHRVFADVSGGAVLMQLLLGAPGAAPLAAALLVAGGQAAALAASEGPYGRERRTALVEILVFAGYLGARLIGCAAAPALALLAVAHLAADVAFRTVSTETEPRGDTTLAFDATGLNVAVLALLAVCVDGFGPPSGVALLAAAVVAGRRCEQLCRLELALVAIAAAVAGTLSLTPDSCRILTTYPLLASLHAVLALGVATLLEKRLPRSLLAPNLQLVARALTALTLALAVPAILTGRPASLDRLLEIELYRGLEVVGAAALTLALAAWFSAAGEPGWRWLAAGSGFVAAQLGGLTRIEDIALEAGALVALGALLVHAELLFRRNHLAEPLYATGMACLLVPFARFAFLAAGTLFDRPLVSIAARDLGLVLTAEAAIFVSLLHRRHGVALMGLVLAAGSIGLTALLGWAGSPLPWSLELVAWIDLALLHALAAGGGSAIGRWVERASGERLDAARWQAGGMSALAAASALLVSGSLSPSSRAALLAAAAFHCLRLDPLPSLHGGFIGFALLSSAAFLQGCVAGLVARGVGLEQFFAEPWFASAAFVLSGIWWGARRRLSRSSGVSGDVDSRVRWATSLARWTMAASAIGGAFAVPSGLGQAAGPVARLALLVGLESVASLTLAASMPRLALMARAVALIAWPVAAVSGFLAWHNSIHYPPVPCWMEPGLAWAFLLTAAGFRAFAMVLERVEDSKGPSTANEVVWLAGAAAFAAQAALVLPLLIATIDKPSPWPSLGVCLGIALAAHIVRPSRGGQFVAWTAFGLAAWSLVAVRSDGLDDLMRMVMIWPVVASVGAAGAVLYALVARRLPETGAAPFRLDAAPMRWAASTLAWLAGALALLVFVRAWDAFLCTLDPHVHWSLVSAANEWGTTRGTAAASLLLRELFWLASLYGVAAYAAGSRLLAIPARGCWHAVLGVLCMEIAFAAARALDPAVAPSTALVLTLTLLAWSLVLEAGRIAAAPVWGGLQAWGVSQAAVMVAVAGLPQLDGPDRLVVLALLAGLAPALEVGGSVYTGFVCFTAAVSAAAVQIAATGCAQAGLPLERFALDGFGALLFFGLFLTWELFARRFETRLGDADPRREWADQLAQGCLGVACILALASTPAAIGTEWSHVVRMASASMVLLSGGVRFRNAARPEEAAGRDWETSAGALGLSEVFGAAGLAGWTGVALAAYAAASGEAADLHGFVFVWPHLATGLALAAIGYAAAAAAASRRLAWAEPVLRRCTRAAALMTFLAAAAAAIAIALGDSSPLAGIVTSFALAVLAHALIPSAAGQIATGALVALVPLLAAAAWFDRQGMLLQTLAFWPVIASLALIPAAAFLGLARLTQDDTAGAAGELRWLDADACRSVARGAAWVSGAVSCVSMPVMGLALFEAAQLLVRELPFPGVIDPFLNDTAIGHLTLGSAWVSAVWAGVALLTGWRLWRGAAVALGAVSMGAAAVWLLGLSGLASFPAAIESVAAVWVTLAWSTRRFGARWLDEAEWRAWGARLAPLAAVAAQLGWVHACFTMSHGQALGVLAVATALAVAAAAFEESIWLQGLAILSIGSLLVEGVWVLLPAGTTFEWMVLWPFLPALFLGYGLVLGWVGRKSAAARRVAEQRGAIARIHPAACLQVAAVLMRAAGPMALIAALPAGSPLTVSIGRMAAGCAVQLAVLAATGAVWLELSTLLLAGAALTTAVIRHAVWPALVARVYPWHAAAVLVLLTAAAIELLERAARHGRLAGRLHRTETLAAARQALEAVAGVALLLAFGRALLSDLGLEGAAACALAALLCLPLRRHAPDYADFGLVAGLSAAAYEVAAVLAGGSLEALFRTPAFCCTSLALTVLWRTAGTVRARVTPGGGEGVFVWLSDVPHQLASAGTVAAIFHAIDRPPTLTIAAVLLAASAVHLSRLVFGIAMGPSRTATSSLAFMGFAGAALAEACVSTLPRAVFDPALLGWPLSPLLLLVAARALRELESRCGAEGAGRPALPSIAPAATLGPRPSTLDPSFPWPARLSRLCGEGTWATFFVHAAAVVASLGPLHPSSPAAGRVFGLAYAAAVVCRVAWLRENRFWLTAGSGMALAVPFRAAWIAAGDSASSLLLGWPVFAAAAAAVAFVAHRLEEGRWTGGRRPPEWCAGPIAVLAWLALGVAAYGGACTLSVALFVGPGAAARLGMIAVLLLGIRQRIDQPAIGLGAAAFAALAVANLALVLALGPGSLGRDGVVPVAAATFALLALLWEVATAGRRPRWCPPELLEVLPTRVVAVGALLATVAWYAPHPRPATAIAMVVSLATSGLYFLRTAHVTGDSRAVYIGEAALAGVYVYLRASGLVQGSAWSGFIGVLVNFLLLGASHLAERWRSPVFAVPMARTALAVPFILMAVFLHRGATPANILMVFASASFYSSASSKNRWYPLRFLGAALYNVGLAMVWTRLQFDSWTAYLSPIGMTFLWASEIERAAFSPAGRARLRQLASAFLMASPLVAFLTEQSITNMLQLAAICLVAIFGGIWLRVRSFLYFGSMLLAGDLLVFAISKSLAASISAVWLLLAAGGGVLALAAFFEKKRDELAQRIDRLRSELAGWE